MRFEINKRLLRRNRQIAQYLFFFSLGVLIIGFFVSNRMPSRASSAELIEVLLPSLVLPIGLVTTLVSVHMTNTWIREPRPENTLKDALKGLSNKSVIYHYFHNPAKHVLVTPQGIFAITTRFQNGSFKVEGDKWSSPSGPLNRIVRLFRQDAVGNPTQDAINNAQHVENLLRATFPEIGGEPGSLVQPLIVFYDANVRLEINNPTVPVLFPDTKRKPNLKDYLRDVAKEGRFSLTPAQIETFEAATVLTKKKK